MSSKETQVRSTGLSGQRSPDHQRRDRRHDLVDRRQHDRDRHQHHEHAPDAAATARATARPASASAWFSATSSPAPNSRRPEAAQLAAHIRADRPCLDPIPLSDHSGAAMTDEFATRLQAAQDATEAVLEKLLADEPLAGEIARPAAPARRHAPRRARRRQAAAPLHPHRDGAPLRRAHEQRAGRRRRARMRALLFAGP